MLLKAFLDRELLGTSLLDTAFMAKQVLCCAAGASVLAHFQQTASEVLVSENFASSLHQSWPAGTQAQDSQDSPSLTLAKQVGRKWSLLLTKT